MHTFDPLSILVGVFLTLTVVLVWWHLRRPFYVRLGISKREWEQYREVLGLNTVAEQRKFVEDAEQTLEVQRRRPAWRR